MENSISLNEEGIGKIILDAAFKVHSTLGPGLLESVYESALAIELTKRGLNVERQKPIPVFYEDKLLDVGFRADLLVESKVLVELKSVQTVTPLFRKITTNYVRLLPVRLGFLFNFNEIHLKDGIMRVVNGLEGKPLFDRREDRAGIDSHDPSLPSRPSRDSFFQEQA
jgi:GxxExxY protein